MENAAAFPERPSAPQFIRAPRTRRGLRALWVALIATVGISFAALLYFGAEIYQMAPPIPEAIETTNGQLVFDRATIHRGQDVWRSVGGQELGSVWGHGAYTAPDWTADWLHHEAVWLAETWSRSRHGVAFDDLDPEQSAALQARLQTELRTNTYNPDTGVITVSADRARAIQAVQSHYTALFGDDPALHQLREDYAMPSNVIPDAERREAFTAFIFWASWATVTERPDPRHHLHPQLAARRSRRQPCDAGHGRHLRHQLCAAARRHWRAGVVLRRQPRPSGAARCARRPPTRSSALSRRRP